VAKIEEHFFTQGNFVCRDVELRGRKLSSSRLPISTRSSSAQPDELFDFHWLLSPAPPRYNQASAAEVKIVDLFCGGGFLSLGVREACNALGLNPNVTLGVELDPTFANAYQRNLDPEQMVVGDVAEIFPTVEDQSKRRREIHAAIHRTKVDLLLAGPPCQGHSRLNNQTRHDDPRNQLLTNVVNAIKVLQPKVAIIENVRGLNVDRSNILKRTRHQLKSLGYGTTFSVLRAQNYGVPQNRERAFLLAIKGKKPSPLWECRWGLSACARPISWVLDDLREPLSKRQVFDFPSKASPRNQERINFLFRNQTHELPDEMRPPCHQGKSNSYPSIYGRMHWDKPAQTITTGFNSPGQGRFIHPLQARTITPHEAARIQTIPDFYNFGTQSRATYSKLIGNAVPPLLAYSVALDAITQAIIE